MKRGKNNLESACRQSYTTEHLYNKLLRILIRDPRFEVLVPITKLIMTVVNWY